MKRTEKTTQTSIREVTYLYIPMSQEAKRELSRLMGLHPDYGSVKLARALTNMGYPVSQFMANYWVKRLKPMQAEVIPT